MNPFSKIISTTAAFGLMSGMALGASAAGLTEVTSTPIGEMAQISVSFADLNLDTPEGQEVLHYRISRAAGQICGPNDTRRAGGVAQAARNEDCYRISFSKALSEISHSIVASTN